MGILKKAFGGICHCQVTALDESAEIDKWTLDQLSRRNNTSSDDQTATIHCLTYLRGINGSFSCYKDNNFVLLILLKCLGHQIIVCNDKETDLICLFCEIKHNIFLSLLIYLWKTISIRIDAFFLILDFLVCIILHLTNVLKLKS